MRFLMRRSLRRVVLMGAIILFLFTMPLSLKEEIKEEIRKDFKVISVQVKENDTLWDIATQYYTPEQGTLAEYIVKIMETNKMPNENVITGMHLVIPYYES